MYIENNFNLNCLKTGVFSIDSSPYYYDNYAVPRVSNILSTCINEDYIPRWANYLGFKRKNYTDTLNMYAEIGTFVHEIVEDILLQGYSTITPPTKYIQSVNNSVNGFIAWYSNIINNTTFRIESTERELICPYFGGTCDLLITINGKKYLMDFKTSKQISFKHILQLCAYKYILENYYNEKIDGIGLLYLSRDNPIYTEYIFHYDEYEEEIDDMTSIFLSLVHSYYGISMIDKNFNVLKK